MTFSADQPGASPRLHRLAVGELYNPKRTRWPEALQWRLSDLGVELVMCYPAPTDKEVNAVRKGAAQFALLSGEHALILAHRFAPLNWADTPWQARRQTDVPVGLPPVGPQGNLLIIAVLVDANTGIVQAIRNTTWPPEFVEAVRAAMRKQILHKSTDAQGATEINAWYTRYPTTDELVRAADIRTG